MSIIRADSIKNRAGNGAPDFPNGITVTGVVTATSTSQSITGNLTVTGNANIGGVLTYEDVTNVDSVGVITARSEIQVGSAVTANSGGVDTVGVVTATSFKDKAGGTFAPNPTTTRGDLIIRGVSVNERLAIGSAGQTLKVNSSGNGLEYGGGGKTLQSKYARTNSLITSSNNYGDKYYPNNFSSSDGTQILGISITPLSNTSHFQIWYSGDHGCGGNANFAIALFHGTTRVTTMNGNAYAGDNDGMVLSAWIDTTGLSGSQSIQVRNMGSNGGHTQRVNGDHSGNNKNTYAYLQIHEVED